MKVKLRHKVVTAILRIIFRVYTRLRYNLRTEDFRPREGSKPPYLIVANHNGNLDPFFIGLCFPFPVFYVASDHIFRLGFLSRMIRFLVSPIPKLKSTSDVRTVRDMITSLRSGASVCVFPEGDRSWSGETETMYSNVGNLAARMHVGLVICRIHGGYLSTPRWGDKPRRGRMECKPVMELLPEELGAIGETGLADIIVRELRVSAREDQKRWKVPYRGKNLAQSIETMLYACPQCGGLATLSSHNDTAVCTCGLHFTYTAMGELQGAPFIDVHAWNLWQTGYLRGVLERGGDGLVFADEKQFLYIFKRAEESRLIAQGRLCLYRDRFTFQDEHETIVLYIHEITEVDIWGALTLQISLADGRHYEIKTRGTRSAYKYLQAYHILRSASRSSR